MEFIKKNNKLSLGDFSFNYKDRTNWSLSVKQVFKDSCMICDWKETSCDVHHIIARKDNGPNSIYNAIVLCPNHHKLADMDLISKEYLQNLTNKKIQSILVELKGDNNEHLDN